MLRAHAAAGIHALAVVLMLTGALIALRRPAVLLVHAPVSAAILAVNVARAPDRAGAGAARRLSR
ncbi:MAG TPA: hypothetical protein VHF92_16020 [Geodermatophilus sp.]|nr:hypothetical protein [Geodermatophilus sp.]